MEKQKETEITGAGVEARDTTIVGCVGAIHRSWADLKQATSLQTYELLRWRDSPQFVLF